jgi:uncharacterized membrane protein (DUF485 family)
MSTPGDTSPGGPAETAEDDRRDDLIGHRIRVVLAMSVLLVVLVLLLPILASFTSVLDGVVGGVGVAYIVGFAEFVIAMAGAVVYCRWINRLEAVEEPGHGESP